MNPAVFGPLARLAAPDDPTLEGLARRVALPVAGTLTFNPSPFGRSEVVEQQDGRLQLITDVPGLGYAYQPNKGAGGQEGSAPVRETLRPVETAAFAMRLDERTGAVASLVNRATGRDLARSGGTINALEGATLSDAWVERYRGIGTRLVARRTVGGGTVTSRVTILDSLPWAELDNLADAGTTIPEAWRFDLSPATREVMREVAGGTLTQPPPLTSQPLLRWLALRGESGTTLFGSDAPGSVSMDETGTLVAYRAGRSARFRLMVQPGYLLPDDPWRFGFGMVPMAVVAAPGTGPLRLPSFGRLLEIADPAVAVVGLKDADDGVGVMVYLMDLAGTTRELVVRPAVLGFEGGVATDLAERDRGLLASAPDGGLRIPIESLGYAAFRLLGVRVAG